MSVQEVGAPAQRDRDHEYHAEHGVKRSRCRKADLLDQAAGDQEPKRQSINHHHPHTHDAATHVFARGAQQDHGNTDHGKALRKADQGEAGDNIGALLRGTKREEVERGQVLCKPGSVKPHTKFKAEAYILTKEEGGRHTPFFTNYRPQFYFRTTDVTGVVTLPEGVEMVMPGDNVAMEVALIVPIAMEEKLRFAIREGGRTVGAGVVAKIIE